MSQNPQHCPFCHTPVGRRDKVCKGCRAHRHRHQGMSPASFRAFFGAWLALAVPLIAVFCWVGFAPWAPSGVPPAYALALVHRSDKPPQVERCSVMVSDASGRMVERVVEGSCQEAAERAARGEALAPRNAMSGPSLTVRRMATALHTLLCLLAGLGGSWALLKALRPLFLTRSEPSWVRRTA